MARVVDKKESQPPPPVASPPTRPDNGASSSESSRPEASGESDGGGDLTGKDPGSSLARLMSRTGCSIVQQNGQRRYGPPSDWTGSVPKRGCEVFVGKIPRDSYEDELVPIFERVGKIYEIRLMMDYNGQNRGYAFIVFSKPSEAKECVNVLDNYEIRKGRCIGVCMSVDNCRLFVGGIPKKVTKEDIKVEMERVTEGVVDIIVYPSASDKSKNRGFAFVEYESHRAAAMARRLLMNGRVQLFCSQLQIAVDWAEPELEVDEDIMAQVKVLYVRNLMLSTTEARIIEVFSKHATVERVKKIRDYAFVHFMKREGAITAMNHLNGSTLDGAIIEVTLAKPVDKDTYQNQRGQRYQKPVTTVQPTIGLVPMDYSFLSPVYSRYVPRNSRGAKVVKSPRNAKGKPKSFYPMAFGSHLVFPASPTNSPYLPQYLESPKRAQVPEEPVYDVVPGLDLSPAASHQAPPSHHLTPQQLPPPTHPPTLSLKQARTPLQILEEVCSKNNWGQPLCTLFTTTPSNEGQLFQYKVYIPALSTTYFPTKFSRSMEEAQYIAAEYALVQLGYPLEATTYITRPHIQLQSPLAPEVPHPPATLPHPQAALPHPQAAMPHPQAALPHPQAALPHPQAALPHPFTATHNYIAITPKHMTTPTFSGSSWQHDPNTTVYTTGYDVTYSHPHFQHPTEIYHRGY